MSKKRNRYDIPHEDFVRIWTAAESMDEVSEATRMPADIASAFANKLRRRGVRLKKMPRVKKSGLDVEALNNIIESVSSKKPAKVDDKTVIETISRHLKKRS